MAVVLEEVRVEKVVVEKVVVKEVVVVGIGPQLPTSFTMRHASPSTQSTPDRGHGVLSYANGGNHSKLRMRKYVFLKLN